MLVGLFGVRGLVRGTIRQVFGFLGLLVGLWAAGWIARWVGEQWLGARPAVVFWGLSWLVAALGGLAVATLFGWVGELLGRAVKAGPAGWLDRAAGFVLGGGLGIAVAAFTLMVGLLAPLPAQVGDWAVDSRFPAPIMRGAAHACAVSDRVFPGSEWLRSRFSEAARRATRRVRDI